MDPSRPSGFALHKPSCSSHVHACASAWRAPGSVTSQLPVGHSSTARIKHITQPAGTMTAPVGRALQAHQQGQEKIPL